MKAIIEKNLIPNKDKPILDYLNGFFPAVNKEKAISSFISRKVNQSYEKDSKICPNLKSSTS
jgi:hypothetical protein